ESGGDFPDIAAIAWDVEHADQVLLETGLAFGIEFRTGLLFAALLALLDRTRLLFAALLALVEPDAERDINAEFCTNLRDLLHAAGRGIRPERPSIRSDRLEVSANALLRRGAAFVIGMGRGGERRI